MPSSFKRMRARLPPLRDLLNFFFYYNF